MKLSEIPRFVVGCFVKKGNVFVSRHTLHYFSYMHFSTTSVQNIINLTFRFNMTMSNRFFFYTFKFLITRSDLLIVLLASREREQVGELFIYYLITDYFPILKHP